MNRNHYDKKWNTPVLVLGCKIGALAIMRTLGVLGVKVYGVDDNPRNPVLKSRFLEQSYIKTLDPKDPAPYLEFVLAVQKIIGQKAILIPTSDDLSLFVAEHRETLEEFFMFPNNSPELMDSLADKQKMFELALENNVPTPNVISPKSLEELQSALDKVEFPLMLKAIDGNKLQERKGLKMKIVESEQELLSSYQELEDPEDPNLMLQELIPGADDQVYIFNGYFDKDSNCLAAFTGHKVRQYPVHLGCAALGECRWHQQVADQTIALMQAVGYQGILDIGYRLDPRDGKYKVLDINPRVGQAFRIFVAKNQMDVIRSLYLDLTGQDQPEIKPREGRRWMIEDYDIISSVDYYQEGDLKFFDWLKSFKGLQEAAWFSWRDPMPFLVKMGRFSAHGLGWLGRKILAFIRPKSAVTR